MCFRFFYADVFIQSTEAHSETNQTSEMELFTKTGNALKPLAISAESSILVSLRFECTSEART